MGEGTKIGDVYFQIGADLAQFNKALAQAQAQSETFGQVLRRSFSDLGAIVGDVFKRRINIGEGFSALKAQVGNLGSSLKAALGTGLQAIFNGSVGVIKKGISGIGAALKDVGRGFLLGVGAFGLTSLVQKMVTAIPDLISQGKAFGQVVADVTQVTGVAGERASKFVGVLELMGSPMNNIVQLLAQFQRNIQTPAVVRAFGEIGISIYDLNGNIKDAITLLDEGRAAIERLGIGTETIGNIQRAFGRGGIKIFDDYIRMSATDMDQLIAKVEALGLVMSSEQAQLAENMSWTMNQWKLTLTGIGVGLFEAVGPIVNSLLSSLSDFVATHREEIVDFFASIAASVAGFVAGLVNANLALASFVDTLDATVRTQSSSLATLMSRQNDVTELEAKLAEEKQKGAGASKAAAASIDAQTRALDRQAKELQELDAIQEKVYRNAIEGINAQLDAQLALMDIEDQRRGRLERDAQLAEALRDANQSLNEAQIELLKAQAGEKGKVDADAVAKQMEAVVEAQRKIEDAKAAIAGEAIDRASQDRRAQIAAVKEYIANLDKIVSDALTRADARRSLAGQAAILSDQLKAAKESGDTVRAGDIQAELDAVRQTQRRLNQQIANEKKQDTIAALKAQLAEERSLISNSSKTTTEIRLADAKRLRDQAAKNYALEQQGLERLKTLTKEWGIELGDEKKPESIGSRFRKIAMQTAEWVDGFKKGLADIIAQVGTLAGSLGHVFDGFFAIIERIPKEIRWTVVGAILGGAAGGVPGAAVGAIVGGSLQLGELTTSNEAQRRAILANARTWVQSASTSELSSARAEVVRALRDVVNNVNPLIAGDRGLRASLQAILNTIDAAIAGTTNRASGGMVGTGGRQLSWLGERGPEFVLNNRVLGALNRLNVSPVQTLAAVSAGGSSGQPVVVRLEIGGHPLLDYMDKHLIYRQRV
jgi:hypothetical protein